MAHNVFHTSTPAPTYGLAQPAQLGNYTPTPTPSTPSTTSTPTSGGGTGFDFSSMAKIGSGMLKNLFPSGVGADVAKAALNRPMPTSAAKLRNTMPVNINTGGINFGAIMQPYNGSPANGAAAMSVKSPMGASIGSVSLGSKTVLYAAGVGAGVLLLILMVKM